MTSKPPRHRKHHWRRLLHHEQHHPHGSRCHKKSSKLSEDVPLSAMSSGQIGTIRELRGGRVLVSRLASLGFTPGASVEMIHNYGLGPLIVEIRDSRIALGRGEARRVSVGPYRAVLPDEEDSAEE